MSEQAPKFTLYTGDDESGFGEIKTAEKAEKISVAVLGGLQEQRQLNTFEDIATNPNAWVVFSYEYDKQLKNEIDGMPESQTDHLVFAAYRMQKARAIEQYLYQAKIKRQDLGRKKAIFEELKLVASAEAEQSIATAIFRAGEDVDIRREIVALFVAIGATKWGGEMEENLQRLRAGSVLEDGENQEAMGLMRGVTGHAAAIDILQTIFNCETFSPSVDIDGRHGIDIGARPVNDADLGIGLAVQVKARNTLENSGGVFLTAVSANLDEGIGFVQAVDKSRLSPEERVRHERELAIGKLQGGMFWLKKQEMTSVDEDNLVGILMELRSSPYGKEFNSLDPREGYFDIHTGLCNDALREEVYRQGEDLLRDIEQIRENSRTIYQGSFRKRGKVGAA